MRDFVRAQARPNFAPVSLSEKSVKLYCNTKNKKQKILLVIKYFFGETLNQSRSGGVVNAVRTHFRLGVSATRSLSITWRAVPNLFHSPLSLFSLMPSNPSIHSVCE